MIKVVVTDKSQKGGSGLGVTVIRACDCIREISGYTLLDGVL